MREQFKLYANLRPARTLIPGGRFDNIDLVVVRENLEGLYIGHEHYIQIDDDPHAVAMATGVNTRQGSRRLLEFAFEHAIATGRKKVAIVHKANIMKALTGIFLETGLELYDRKYKGRFELETVIIDACAMKLVLNPWQFDVLVTTNLFGDILSDLVAGLVGGLGMTPGANIGANAAIFEAVHGSAPDIAGKGDREPHRADARRRDDARALSPAAHGGAPAHRHRSNAQRRWRAHRRSGRQGEHRGVHPRVDQAPRQNLSSPHPSAQVSGMRPIVSINNVTKSYASGFQALKLINLDIDQGEIFALLGPNGAGKTTLINIVCGIVIASSGTVTADGHDIVRDYRAARSMIGLVPQELSTDAFETVWATVTFSRGLFGRAPNPCIHRAAAARPVAARQAPHPDHGTVRRHEAPRDDRQGAVPRAADTVPR